MSKFLLLHVDRVPEILDPLDRIRGEGLGADEGGELVGGVAHWVHDTRTVVVGDSNEKSGMHD